MHPVFRSGRILAMLALVVSARGQQPSAQLEIDVQKVIAHVNPGQYGLMTEEINYSYDGGLYGELVHNRAFQDSDWGIPHWTVVQNASAGASMIRDKSTGPSAALTSSLKLVVTAADAKDSAGVANDGFWGIPLRAHATYKGSFYAKADTTFSGPIVVKVINNKTGAAAATATIQQINPEWKQYQFEFETGDIQAGADNTLQLTVQHAGTVWFSLVSLFPPTYKARVNGFRPDLMEKLSGLHPAFLRFPGGNYLEGDHISERYEWKKTIGPLVDRPTHPSPWRYHSSDGMGLLEFLEWCEDLDMQPLLAVYAGYSMSQEHVNPGPELDPYIQDALEEVEYVTGSLSTKWGAQRARDGHPKPFELTYVEIGNEDWFDKSGSYDGRFAQYYDAFKKKYPQLQLIATTPVKSRKPDVVDDHFYESAQHFFNDVHHYDKTDRNGPKIFVGEWATREGSPTPNFGAALGDAAWMTGMERNGDIVIMDCYAPLLVNVNPGGMQWESDLIGYDTMTSYGSPSYYAHGLFNIHRGADVLQSTLSGEGPRLFYSVTKNSATKVVYLKVVNASPEAAALHIKLAGAGKVRNTAKLYTLSAGTTEDTNTISDPVHIIPVQSEIDGVRSDWQRTFPRYSISVVEIGVD